MKKIWLGIILAMLGMLYTSQVQAAEISVVVLPNPIGLPEIIFALGLCGFALWKTGWIRVLLSICIIIWGTFAMSYDIKIAAPLVGIGAVLFIMATINLIGQYKQSREET